MKKRFLSFLLVVIMLTTLCPMSLTFADQSTLITEIEVTIKQIPMAGESTDTSNIEVTTDYGDVVSIVRAYWYNNTTASEKDATFIKGNEYKLCVTIAPDEKYDFLYGKYRFFDGTATFNGEDAAYAYASGDIPGALYLESPEYIAKTVTITEITATMPQPATGASTDTGKLKFTTEHGDVVTILRAYWYNNDTASSTDKAFKNGNEYKLCVNIGPDEKYDFLYGKYRFFDGTATFNGEDAAYAYASGDIPGALYMESPAYTVRTVPGTLITEIAVTGMQIPASGASTDTSNIKVTTDQGDVVVLDRAYWYNNDTASETDETFKDGNEYKLCVGIYRQSGYDFLYDKYKIFDGTATFNGEDAAYAFASGENQEGMYLESPAFIAQTVPITEIEVTGMQTPAAGASTDTSNVKVTTEHGDVVTVHKSYWYNTSTGSPTDKTFINGDEYYLSVYIYPKTGYKYAYNDFGKFTGTATFNGEDAEYAFESGDYEGAMYLEGPHFRAQTIPITEIEVTGIQTPEVGESTDTSNVKVTTEHGDTVTIHKAYWYNNSTGSSTDEAFKDGDEYYLTVYIYPMTGYEYAYNESGIFTGTATFNGEDAEYAFESGDYEGAMYLEGPHIKVTSMKDPTAADFVFIPPKDLIYNGKEKPAIVNPADGVSGMGSITVKYSSDGTAYDSVPPKKVGTYKVAIDVNEGDSYTAATSVTSDDWTFTIVPTDPVHNYDSPYYVWTGDSCTAERTCILCSESREGHKETETVKGSYVKDTEATCTEAEKGHYKAEFTNPAFAVQNTAANSVTNGNPKDHDYQIEQYNAEQHRYVCQNDKTHIEYEDHSFDGNTCTKCGYIINTEEPDVPQTGDESRSGLWSVLLLLCSAGLIGIGIFLIKRCHFWKISARKWMLLKTDR